MAHSDRLCVEHAGISSSTCKQNVLFNYKRLYGEARVHAHTSQRYSRWISISAVYGWSEINRKDHCNLPYGYYPQPHPEDEEISTTQAHMREAKKIKCLGSSR